MDTTTEEGSHDQPPEEAVVAFTRQRLGEVVAFWTVAAAKNRGMAAKERADRLL